MILKIRIPKPVASAIQQVCHENGWGWADVAEEVLRSWAEGLKDLPSHPARGRTSGQPLDSSPRVDRIRGGSRSRKGK